MNVYDFDKTIYAGDSTTDFSMFVLKRHPICFIHLPAVAAAAVFMGAKWYTKDRFKGILYKYLKHIPDIDAEVEEFWGSHRKNIQDWYLIQKKTTDLIISASPVFLLEPVAKELGVSLIASPVDKKTGELLGPNNCGEAKVKRFKEVYGTETVESFYSDSDDDLPMARLAERAYKVKNGEISPWKKLN